MKKLTAMLLMICLLLTLASCGKKEEADAGVKARTFATETDMSTMTVTVQGGEFAMENMGKEPVFTGEATRRDDGTYILEPLRAAGGVTLTPFRDGYYKVTAAEMVDSSLLASALIKLNGEHSFSAHNYMKMSISFMAEENRKILRLENQGMVMEVWNEGAAFTGYQVARGNYNLRDRGETKLLDLNVSWGGYDTTTGSGMLTGDKLEITLDGEEVILRLKANGAAEMLSADDSEDIRFTCVPGEKLEVIADDMVMMSFQVEDDKLTINSDQNTDGMLPLTLTEVK